MSTPKEIYISSYPTLADNEGGYYNKASEGVFQESAKYIRADVVEELKRSLNDLLTDCINFDGGKLTDIFMEQASNTLKAHEGGSSSQ